MTIDDLDVFRVSFMPAKTHPPLVVDPDAPLPRSVTPQHLEAVARQHAKSIQADRALSIASLR
jgi:hypothetical protein